MHQSSKPARPFERKAGGVRFSCSTEHEARQQATWPDLTGLRPVATLKGRLAALRACSPECCALEDSNAPRSEKRVASRCADLPSVAAQRLLSGGAA